LKAETKTSSRILFLDLMRAYAVLMMVQGHTIDAFMVDTYRYDIYPLYYLWNFLRGLNAPIFMFTSGAVFTYLLNFKNIPYSENTRVKKGLKRVWLLLFIGYLLHYPTWTIFYFGNLTGYQWNLFFKVDALQLIAVGIATILGLFYLINKFKINEYFTFTFFSLFSAVITLYINKINFMDFMPFAFAAYFDTKTGSYFPIFPWISYVTSGAILGTYLARNPNIFKSKIFSIKLLSLGAISIILSLSWVYYELSAYGRSTLWETPNLIILRLGIIILLNGIVSFIAANIKKLPGIILLIGQNTLLIYALHLIIIFGSSWNLGISFFYNHALSPTLSVILAICMIGLMVAIVYFKDKYSSMFNSYKITLSRLFNSLKSKLVKSKP